MTQIQQTEPEDFAAKVIKALAELEARVAALEAKLEQEP